MKGLTHFISAVAAASCVPGVIEHASSERGLILVLAGAFGLLPDWLDFKWTRYLERTHHDIRPTEDAFDADAIAMQMAQILETVWASGQPQRVQLHTMQLASDRWQRYSLRFDPYDHQLTVKRGPIVDTGQQFVCATQSVTAIRSLSMPVYYGYDGDLKVDIFEGPTIEFSVQRDPKTKEKRIEIDFLPWHRRWTHSLTLGIVLGGLLALGLGWQTGLAIGLGWITHVLQDQLGHMGSNLWWPLTTRRSAGLKWMHSGDALPNFLTVWLAVAVILLNINLAADVPQFTVANWLIWGVILPSVGLGSAYVYTQRATAAQRQKRKMVELMEELVEPQV